jgi:hypothetical protein
MPDAPPLSDAIDLNWRNRLCLLVEVIVFALPCYLIFTLCAPLSLLGLWLLVTMLLDSIGNPKTIDDLRGFAPLAIASATAILGIPALWMFAKLLVRIFRNKITQCAARVTLVKALRWGAVPFVVLPILLIASWGPVPQEPRRFEDLALEIIFEIYVSGWPLLIPIVHLWRLSRMETQPSILGLFPR